MVKVIYFHVGISKTGSTFLQQRVFPFLKNIHYIPTRKYFKIGLSYGFIYGFVIGTIVGPFGSLNGI